ncbi:MAG: SIMPL domain-containing protein [Bacillota bacterium]|jgi:uncharacterized protein YggE|nr:SIMPL domain-containing protein [Bacillota bacterium]NLJ03095.1 SIMPL domain-containing protein [Bacillota bacterium]
MRKSLLKVGVLVVLLSLSSLALAETSPPERGSLQVTGSAIVTGAPDVAYITLGVETRDASADKAAQENADRMAKVFDALYALGLTDKELTTSGYNIYSSTQVLNRGLQNEEYITTYHVHNRINVKTKDLTSVGQIIDAAVKAGANQVQGVTFDIEDKQEMQLEALKNAIRQGMAKAEVMADAAGITLGGIASINENYASYAPVVSAMAFRLDAAAETTINPDDVEVTATVNLDFWF